MRHADPDAVAAAIEALVELHDGSLLSSLEPLKNDKRMVQMADEDSDQRITEITVGELAKEAIALLSDS